MDGGEMLDRFLPQASELQKKHLLKQQGERYRRAELHRVRAFAGVRDLFARLKQEGCAVGIATTCKQDELAAYDQSVQALDLADAIACGDDTRHGKPDPALYRLALAKLGLAETCRAMAVAIVPTMPSQLKRSVCRQPGC
jgi:phosphoglycolate phosphatase-like HAD superfamily hydrolase